MLSTLQPWKLKYIKIAMKILRIARKRKHLPDSLERNMIDNPSVSVILPVYNAEDTINRTLEALAAQTLSNIEIICVNDGSADTSRQLIEAFAASHSNFFLINSENQGAYLARELGIRHSSGKYIGFCDAGDIPSPVLYETLLDRIISNNADLAVCAYSRINGDKSFIEMQGFGNSVFQTNEDKGWLATINTSLWNKLIKRDLLQDRIQPDVPPRIMEDAFLLYSIFGKIERIVTISDPLYSYIVSETSAMGFVDPKEASSLFESWLQIRNSCIEADNEMQSLIDLGAFIHLGLSLNLRLAMNGNFRTIGAIARITRALRDNFPLCVSNPYLVSSYVQHHPSLRLAKMANILFSLKLVPFALFLYSKLIRLTRIGISW